MSGCSPPSSPLPRSPAFRARSSSPPPPQTGPQQRPLPTWQDCPVSQPGLLSPKQYHGSIMPARKGNSGIHTNGVGYTESNAPHNNAVQHADLISSATLPRQNLANNMRPARASDASDVTHLSVQGRRSDVSDVIGIFPDTARPEPPRWQPTSQRTNFGFEVGLLPEPAARVVPGTVVQHVTVSVHVPDEHVPGQPVAVPTPAGVTLIPVPPDVPAGGVFSAEVALPNCGDSMEWGTPVREGAPNGHPSLEGVSPYGRTFSADFSEAADVPESLSPQVWQRGQRIDWAAAPHSSQAQSTSNFLHHRQRASHVSQGSVESLPQCHRISHASQASSVDSLPPCFQPPPVANASSPENCETEQTHSQNADDLGLMACIRKKIDLSKVSLQGSNATMPPDDCAYPESMRGHWLEPGTPALVQSQACQREVNEEGPGPLRLFSPRSSWLDESKDATGDMHGSPGSPCSIKAKEVHSKSGKPLQHQSNWSSLHKMGSHHSRDVRCGAPSHGASEKDRLKRYKMYATLSDTDLVEELRRRKLSTKVAVSLASKARGVSKNEGCDRAEIIRRIERYDAALRVLCSGQESASPNRPASPCRSRVSSPHKRPASPCRSRVSSPHKQPSLTTKCSASPSRQRNISIGPQSCASSAEQLSSLSCSMSKSSSVSHFARARHPTSAATFDISSQSAFCETMFREQVKCSQVTLRWAQLCIEVHAQAKSRNLRLLKDSSGLFNTSQNSSGLCKPSSNVSQESTLHWIPPKRLVLDADDCGSSSGVASTEHRPPGSKGWRQPPIFKPFETASGGLVKPREKPGVVCTPSNGDVQSYSSTDMGSARHSSKSAHQVATETNGAALYDSQATHTSSMTSKCYELQSIGLADHEGPHASSMTNGPYELQSTDLTCPLDANPTVGSDGHGTPWPEAPQFEDGSPRQWPPVTGNKVCTSAPSQQHLHHSQDGHRDGIQDSTTFRSDGKSAMANASNAVVKVGRLGPPTWQPKSSIGSLEFSGLPADVLNMPAWHLEALARDPSARQAWRENSWRVFVQADSDGDEKINRVEVLQCCRQLHLQHNLPLVDHELILRLYGRFDLDMDSLLCFSEFLRLHALVAQLQAGDSEKANVVGMPRWRPLLPFGVSIAQLQDYHVGDRLEQFEAQYAFQKNAEREMRFGFETSCRRLGTDVEQRCMQVAKRKALLPLGYIRAELKRLCTFQHPGIMTLYTQFEDPQQFYLVYNKTDGLVELPVFLATGELQGIAFPWVLGVIIQSLEGITYAHSMGVLHRGFGPGNILVSESDRSHMILTDVGLAELFHHLEYPWGSTTPVSGDFRCAAPEVWDGKYNAKCDVFSCGCVLHLLLYGVLPNSGDSQGPGVLPEPLTTLCTAMLENNDRKRPSATVSLTRAQEARTDVTGTSLPPSLPRLWRRFGDEELRRRTATRNF